MRCLLLTSIQNLVMLLFEKLPDVLYSISRELYSGNVYLWSKILTYFLEQENIQSA